MDDPTIDGEVRSMKGTRNASSWVTPAGAGVAVLCFFLPWVKISCAGSHTLTGAELANHAGVLWIVLIAAAVTLVACTVFRIRGLMVKARPVAIWGPLIGIAAIAFEGVRHWDRIKSDIRVLGLIGVGVALQFGFFGSLAGLFAALTGGIATPKQSTLPPVPSNEPPHQDAGPP